MPYDIEDENLGTVLSYAGIALDQSHSNIDSERTEYLQECLDGFNLQLYGSGRVTIAGREDEEALYALTGAAEQYINERYAKCLESEGPESGFAKQLSLDAAIVRRFAATVESGGMTEVSEKHTENGMDDATLMQEIITALSGTSGAAEDALIDDRLTREMRTMLLKLARERLGL